MAHSPTEVPRQHKEPVRTTEPIQIVRPVQPVIIREVERKPEVPKRQPELPPKPEVETSKPAEPKSKTIREEPTNSAPEPINSAPKNSNNSNNSKKPNETIELFERIGKVGRQRKYEEKGNRGENSVRDVVLYRHIKGRHYPGLSNDMRRWYEFFYFKPPMRGERPFNAKTTYEQHTEAYERGQDWIKRYEAESTKSITGPLGDSRIVDLQKRRAAH